MVRVRVRVGVRVRVRVSLIYDGLDPDFDGLKWVISHHKATWSTWPMLYGWPFFR